MKLRVSRSTLGIIISAIAFAGVFPVIFGLVSRWLDQVFGLPPLFGPPLSSIITAGFWLIGAFWVFWAYSYLIFVGGGSPFEVFGFALEPTKQLVTSGPYSYTRNPAIFGLLWIFAGISTLLQSMGGLILLPILAIIIIIYLKAFEESGLVRRFGADYEHYRQHVPLLFPRLITYIKPEAV